MPRLRFVAAALLAVVLATLVPTAAGASGSSPDSPYLTSDVDFGDCVELSTGTTVGLAELQARVPESVPVLSLTDQGIVFPGSDELGILITRVLECESITVTRGDRIRVQHDRHIAHVGTPVSTASLPASPYNLDGTNGADFNNYVFAYYTDSWIYRDAMRRAGVQNVASAKISLHDEQIDDCLVDRTATVRPRRRANNYGFVATGVIPDASCEPPVVPFVANWWSVRGDDAAVLSNAIPGQSAVFIDPAQTTIELVPTRRSQLDDVFGADSATADAFGVIGHIPDSDGVDLIATQAGTVGGPLDGASFTLQNFLAQPDPTTGELGFVPFFDPIDARVGLGPEVGDFLYDIDISATAITMAWNTTPDADLPPEAVPNDIYPPHVGALVGLTPEEAAASGIADEYWFDVDQDLTGLTFTVDGTQTLVPNVRIEGGSTLVISIPGGTSIGDGFDARILISSE
ncbi:MAG: hypothetical protein AAGA99_13665 [Actinomycetota bacterium]